MRARHVPLRTCVTCGTKTDKRQLVRVVRGTAGNIAEDPTGKAPGRGAYLCPRLECWQTAIDKGRLRRALKTESAPSEEVKRALMTYARERFGDTGTTGVD